MCGPKTFDMFSEWNFCFQIPPGCSFDRALRSLTNNRNDESSPYKTRDQWRWEGIKLPIVKRLVASGSQSLYLYGLFSWLSWIIWILSTVKLWPTNCLIWWSVLFSSDAHLKSTMNAQDTGHAGWLSIAAILITLTNHTKSRPLWAKS